MGLITGIDAIKKAVEKSNADYEDGPKATWVKLGDGQSKKIVFLQEFDSASPNYSERNGTLTVAVEHASPSNYRKKALCTADEGRCFACEMNRSHPKTGWNQKQRLYVNVLILEEGAEPTVAILSQGLGGKSITPTLLEINNEYGSITSSLFRIKRTGAQMNSTSYSLITLPGDTGVNVEDYELYDLSKFATREIPFEDQKEFYEVVDEEAKSESESDFEW